MTEKQFRSQLAIVLEEVKAPPGGSAEITMGKPASPINSTGNIKTSKLDTDKLLD